MRSSFGAGELRSAGVTVLDLLGAGLPLDELVHAGFTVRDFSNAGVAMPALIAPSPITATTLSDLFESLLASAIPNAEDIEVELWAAPNVSYSLSVLFVKPESPPPCLKVLILSFLPVKIL